MLQLLILTLGLRVDVMKGSSIYDCNHLEKLMSGCMPTHTKTDMYKTSYMYKGYCTWLHNVHLQHGLATMLQSSLQLDIPKGSGTSGIVYYNSFKSVADKLNVHYKHFPFPFSFRDGISTGHLVPTSNSNWTTCRAGSEFTHALLQKSHQFSCIVGFRTTIALL